MSRTRAIAPLTACSARVGKVGWGFKCQPVMDPLHSSIFLHYTTHCTHCAHTHTHTHFTTHVSGPGLQSAIVNRSTHVVVELTDSIGKPVSLPQSITAQVETVTETTLATATEWPSFKEQLTVIMISPSQYEVSYVAFARGQCKLHIQVNDIEITGSPFTIAVYLAPTLLGYPVRTVTGLNQPYGIAINSRGEAVISDNGVSIFNAQGHNIRKFGALGRNAHEMISPAGLAVDGTDNIYVSSCHKLQKFTSSGELINNLF